MFHVNGTKNCEICGKSFSPIAYNQRFCCVECRNEAYNISRRGKHKEKNLPTPKPKAHESLSEVARKANALGLTYGQYMVRQKERAVIG